MTEGTVANDSLIGSTLNERFSVVSLISKGGLSVLYKGVDKSSSQQVTIRVLLHARGDDDQAIARFNAALKLMEGVRHANILAILGSGLTPGGAPYLVLPFIDGRSVREKVEKEGRLSFDQALPIIRDIGSALHYAHQHGIIHRNLKPSNILLTEVNGAPRALLTGFGIAKKAPSGTGDSISQTTKVVGSPLYMSPEQFIGSKIDARSDIYSFGCVIHQMLSGMPPFDAPSLVQLMSAHHHQYRPHFSADMDVPAFVDDILDSATLKLPGNRYQTVSQMVTDCENKQCTHDLRNARKHEPAADEENVARQHTIKAAAMVTASGVLLVALIIFIVSFDTLSRSAHNPMAPSAVPAEKRQETIRNLVETGQYPEAIGLLKNQLVLAEASGERTEVLRERIGALSYLSNDSGAAIEQYSKAIAAREALAKEEPDTAQGQQKKIDEDQACLGIALLHSNPNQALQVVRDHLQRPEQLSSMPAQFLLRSLAQYYETTGEATTARSLVKLFSEKSMQTRTDTIDKPGLDAFLINCAERE